MVEQHVPVTPATRQTREMCLSERRKRTEREREREREDSTRTTTDDDK
jgi:hypothetical protein